MAIGGGGGAIAAGGGAVCWAQAASARTAPSTYRCFIVNPPGLMKSALAFAGTGFFDARLRKSSGRFAESIAPSELLIKKRRRYSLARSSPRVRGRGGLGANREPARSPVPSYFRCFLLQMLLTSDASYFRCFLLPMFPH